LLIAYEFISYNILFVPGFQATVYLSNDNVVPITLRHRIPCICDVCGNAMRVLLQGYSYTTRQSFAIDRNCKHNERITTTMI
jgi:hypothetical protein